MASKHKAPTQVTVVQEEKSPFAQWVESNWRMGAIVAIAASGAILGAQYMGQQKQASLHAEWDELAEVRRSGDAAAIEAAAAGLPPVQADLAWLQAAQLRVAEGEYDQALANLDRIRPQNALLASLSLPQGPDGREQGLVEAARARIQAQREQEQALADILDNPPPAPDAPRVRLETSMGPIVIALYPEEAPLHVENFLARVDEAYYDGIKFHRIEQGMVVQTGDPNTRDGDPSTWGTGGPDEKVAPEADNGLIHVPYAVGMARQGQDPRSSGSQFYVALTRRHVWDGEYTVFGVVEGKESRETLAAMEELEVDGNRPLEPPVLQSARRLE